MTDPPPTGDGHAATPGVLAAPAWLVNAYAALLGTVCALLSISPVREADTYMHLRLGQEVLAQGSRTITETLAFTSFTDPCLVPEWLWGVTTTLLYQAGGWHALTGLVFLITLATAFIVVRWICLLSTSRRLEVVVLVSALVMTMAMARLRIRPQSAFLLLLPGFMLLLAKYEYAVGSRRILLGASMVLLEVAWAQLHGSFVLAPAITVVWLAGPWLKAGASPNRKTDLLLLLGLLAGLLASPAGLDLVTYLLDHGGGDAKRHISEWVAPTWAAFQPGRAFFLSTYLVIWALCLAGMAWARRFWWRELALGLMGLALCLEAVRFATTAALLLAPLCVVSLDALLLGINRRRLSATACALIFVGLFSSLAVRLHERRGPLLHSGEAEGFFPRAAGAFCKTLPAGTPVLAGYMANSALSFWAGDRIRVYVDARTPLYFNDTDYGVARDVWAHKGALQRAITRYGIKAVVAGRKSDLCRNMAALGWAPIIVEARHTTFVPSSGAALKQVLPCGANYMDSSLCAEGGARLGRDIKRLEAYGATPFTRTLAAQQALTCQRDVQRARRLLATEDQAREYSAFRSQLLAQLLLAGGDTRGALTLLAHPMRKGDMGALVMVLPAAREDAGIMTSLVDLLQETAVALDDRFPARMRATLATLCMKQGDAECARFHGLRSAVLGRPEALPVLRWLIKNHPAPRVREDAEAWARTLRAVEVGQ